MGEGGEEGVRRKSQELSENGVANALSTAAYSFAFAVRRQKTRRVYFQRAPMFA